jgi:hypothetical protein
MERITALFGELRIKDLSRLPDHSTTNKIGSQVLAAGIFK